MKGGVVRPVPVGFLLTLLHSFTADGVMNLEAHIIVLVLIRLYFQSSIQNLVKLLRWNTLVK